MDILPSGKRLVDVFGGGGSISLHAIDSGKWEQVIYNDRNTSIVNLLKALLTNENNIDLRRFTVPDRETFFSMRDSKKISLEREIILTCWSFSNNRRTYLFGEKTAYKEIVSRALFYGDTGTKWDFLYKNCKSDSIAETYAKYHKEIKLINNNELSGRLQQLEQLQQLQQLQQLEQLEQLQRLQQLHILNHDYRNLNITKNDIVYLDPPYIGTSMQYGGFDHAQFHEWYSNLDNKDIYISEYTQLPNTKIVAKLGKKHSFVASKASNRKEELLLKVVK